MLTTTQVRRIMRKHGARNYGIYTNKLADKEFRSVKCYVDECNSEALVRALTSMKAEFKVTKGAQWARCRGEGIVVKCLASEYCG